MQAHKRDEACTGTSSFMCLQLDAKSCLGSACTMKLERTRLSYSMGLCGPGFIGVEDAHDAHILEAKRRCLTAAAVPGDCQLSRKKVVRHGG